jgi:PTH2 family peptidyl-tRNA hydrolase
MTDANDPDDDGRIRVFVNSNLGWSRGKMAAHVAHTVLTAAGVHPDVPIVVLGAKPRTIEEMATHIRDEGRTELEPGTLTAGTDYVFASAAAREEAVARLLALAQDADDPKLTIELTEILALLNVR